MKSMEERLFNALKSNILEKSLKVKAEAEGK